MEGDVSRTFPGDVLIAHHVFLGTFWVAKSLGGKFPACFQLGDYFGYYIGEWLRKGF